MKPKKERKIPTGTMPGCASAHPGRKTRLMWGCRWTTPSPQNELGIKKEQHHTKKLFVLFLMFFILPSNAIIVDDFSGVCGIEDYDKMYALFEPVQYTCAPGYFLPANTLRCIQCSNGATCPGGTYSFNENYYQGISDIPPYTQDVTNVCGVDIFKKFYALFEPEQYTCAPGYFLPANISGCVPCLDNATCPGGTFSFNEQVHQGISEIPTITQNVVGTCGAYAFDNMYAIFEQIIYDCPAGYYLPANIDECTICPADNLCVGGTFTFNETTDQGIEPCPENYYAPTGSDLVCYPHILHIGNDNVYLKETKTTVPALNIGIGNDVFYANMTTTQTPMNRDTTRQLKIEYDNNLYYVCDDTTFR